jgi:hypothetical protein
MSPFTLPHFYDADPGMYIYLEAVYDGKHNNFSFGRGAEGSHTLLIGKILYFFESYTHSCGINKAAGQG